MTSNVESNESAKEMLFFFSKLTSLPLNYNLRMKLTTTNRFGNLSNLSCKNNQQKAATLSYEDKEKGYRKAFTVDSVSAKVGSGYGKKTPAAPLLLFGLTRSSPHFPPWSLLLPRFPLQTSPFSYWFLFSRPLPKFSSRLFSFSLCCFSFP